MAFTSLNLPDNPSGLAIGAQEYLKERVLRTQADVLSTFNIFPGLTYYFSSLHLMWNITDEASLRKAYARIGLDEDNINKSIQRIKQDPIAINFDFIQTLFTKYKAIHDQMYDYKLKSCTVPLAVTFDTLLDAGATPLENGENVI